MLDAAGDLGLGYFAELELVERIGCPPRVVVRVPETGIVGAWRGELLMTDLSTDRSRETGEPEVCRHELHFDPDLLLLVGEDLPHAVTRRIGILLQPELVVLVVGYAAPEPDRIDEVDRHAPFALADQLDLIGVDARAMILPVDAGDVIERVVLRDREPEKAVAEHVGPAERFAAVVQR